MTPTAVPEPGTLNHLLELLGYSHTILFSLDLDLRVTWVSEVVGMPAEAVIGHRLSEFVPSDEGAALERVAAGVIETLVPVDFEPTVTWLGQPRVYAARVAPVIVDGRCSHLAISITDVTELRAAERRELDVQAALELAMHETGTQAFGTDVEGRIMWASGVPQPWADRLLDHTIEELFPSAAAASAEARAEVAAGADRAAYDLEIAGSDSVVVQRVVVGPVRDATGRLIGFVATTVDVTELRQAANQARRRAEELEVLVASRTDDLAASEERLHVSLDATLDTLAITRAIRDETGAITDFTVEYANQAWRRVYGQGVEDARGRHLYRDFPFFAPRRDTHVDAVEHGRPARDTVEVLVDGVRRQYDYQLTPFGDGFVVASRDVTERVEMEQRLRESERRLRDTIEGIDAIVWEEDLTTGALWVSPQSEQILGYTDEDWAANHRLWVDMVVPEDRERVQAVLDGDENGDVEYTASRKDGVQRRLRDSLTVIRDPSGAVVRKYGLTIDVTSLRRLEARAFSAERLDALGRFAGQVAHDVDNVMYGVGIFARYARQAAADGGDPLPDLDRVIDGLERGSALTRGLLDFARSRPSRPTRVEIGSVVQAFRPILERLADPAVALDVVADRRPLVVLADRAGIEQVLLNLSTNALQAMPDGGRLTVVTRHVRLTADAARAAGVPRGAYAEVVVEDTGRGMDAATLARLGEPFFTTRTEGTGLGVSSVFGIVHAHHGVVDVTSTPGTGTRFRVLLPIAR